MIDDPEKEIRIVPELKVKIDKVLVKYLNFLKIDYMLNHFSFEIVHQVFGDFSLLKFSV